MLYANQVTWCTAIEPLVSSAKRQFSLDHEYLAGCLFPYPPLGSTPYREIRAVLPAHFLDFQYGGRLQPARYWALNPNSRIRYSREQEYDQHFLALFRDSVRQRIRSDRPVLAELSGGLDSSSIVCMADDIRKEEAGSAIETLSYYDTDEPGGDERAYFTEIERHRRRMGHHISVSDFKRRTKDSAVSPVEGTYLLVSPGHFAPSVQWAAMIDGVQHTVNSRVILSGLGGDELLGGVQYEALELMEHLLSANLLAFVNSILQWSLARNKPVIALIKDVLALATARHNLGSFLRQVPTIPWVLVQPAIHDAALQLFSRWRLFSPAHLFSESIRYTLSSQLSCTSVPPIGISEKRYPFLDRSLYSYLASIPRTEVLRAESRRHLMRRSLHTLVPHAVLFRKTKWFGRRTFSAAVRDQQEVLGKMLAERWLSDGVLFDVPLLRERLRSAQHGAVSEARLLLVAFAIEQWLRRQSAFGIIAPL
jgi:asparagine synthase (glutamine-hydrolysing)